MRHRTPFALCAAALLLGGCGSDTSQQDLKQLAERVKAKAPKRASTIRKPTQTLTPFGILRPYVDGDEALTAQRTPASPSAPVGTVGLKPLADPLPDPGPPVTLRIPPKPADARGAYIYKHTVEQFLARRSGDARAYEQTALDVMAAWCGTAQTQYSDICLLWKDIPWREPIADYIYERSEQMLVNDPLLSHRFGVRFSWTAPRLKAGCYSPYLVARSYMMLAKELLWRYPDSPQKAVEADQHAAEARAQFLKMLDEPDLPVLFVQTYIDEFYNLALLRKRDPGPDIMPLLREVEQRCPRALPLARGDFWRRYAWRARGDGFAETVTLEGWRLFSQRLGSAKADLVKAWEQEPSVEAANAMMWVSIGQSDFEACDMWFERGLKLDPHNQELHTSQMQRLCAKWGGSNEAMFKFVRGRVKAFAGHPDGAVTAVQLLMNAHGEYAGRISTESLDRMNQYIARPEVYAEIKHGLENALRHHPQALDIWSVLSRYGCSTHDSETILRGFVEQEKLGFVSTKMFEDRQQQQQVRAQAAREEAAKKRN